jgi:hypothetical protein
MSAWNDPIVGQIWKASDGRRLRIVSVEPNRGRVGCRNVESNRLSYIRLMFFRGAKEGKWSIALESQAASPPVPESSGWQSIVSAPQRSLERLTREMQKRPKPHYCNGRLHFLEADADRCVCGQLIRVPASSQEP